MNGSLNYRHISQWVERVMGFDNIFCRYSFNEVLLTVFIYNVTVNVSLQKCS